MSPSTAACRTTPALSLYEAVYETLVANAGHAGQPKTQTVAVAGKHCETDILIQVAQTQPVETRRHSGCSVNRRVQLCHGVQLQSVHEAGLRFCLRMVEADLVSRRETLDDVVRLGPHPGEAGLGTYYAGFLGLLPIRRQRQADSAGPDADADLCAGGALRWSSRERRWSRGGQTGSVLCAQSEILAMPMWPDQIWDGPSLGPGDNCLSSTAA